MNRSSAEPTAARLDSETKLVNCGFVTFSKNAKKTRCSGCDRKESDCSPTGEQQSICLTLHVLNTSIISQVPLSGSEVRKIGLKYYM